jgi:Domain of unknown function (DUF222)
MPQDLFSDPGPDGEEPDSSPQLPAAEEDWPEDDGPGLQQGLYLYLPAEQMTLAGFAQNGEADTMAPGPLLATIVDTVAGPDSAGLAGCSDDQLMGIISAARRNEARDAWIQLAAMGEYAARHSGSRSADEFAPDELAFELHLTPLSAKEQMDYASTVAKRLPQTFAALAAGQIYAVHLRIIEDETRFLTDQDAATADAILAGAAVGLTFGELRHAAHKLILKLDPEAARKRKEAAKREAHVRRFREESGNAGMVARELPSDEVLASWQHVEQRALDLRAAGMPGTLRELRIRAYLDLLQERDSRDLPANPGPGAPVSDGTSVPDQPASASDLPDSDLPDSDLPDSDLPDSDLPDRDPPGDGPDGSGPSGADGPDGNDGPDGPGGPSGNGPGGPGPGPGPGQAPAPSVAALVTITIPLATYEGRSDTPGEADGFGVLDADEARALAAAAARHPRTRWCVTALNSDGTAAAHACLPGRHPPPGPAPPGTRPPNLKTPLIPVARGPCDHAHAEIGYHPSRKLAHLIRARSATCTAPGCRRPAARCDLDHTVPWDQGGVTCECGLAPLCRHHHRCKQAEGWWLEQPEPGVLVWHTPSGRRHATAPTDYLT